MKAKSTLVVALMLGFLTPYSSYAADDLALSASCSSAVKKSALATITGQNKALGKKDFKSAFAFSSSEFRENSSLPTFTEVINVNFNYLLLARNTQITDCEKIMKFYYFQVDLTSAGTSYSLTYVLQPQTKSQSKAPNKTGYGIAAAQLNGSTLQVNYPQNLPRPENAPNQHRRELAA
jgi:hypothetical protein